MPREDTPRRRNYVSSDDLEDEVDMAMQKLGADPSDDDVINNISSDSQWARQQAQLHGGENVDNGRLHEPVAPAEPKPFVPYCKKNMTSQKSWPFYIQRNALREYFSEFFGTMILITFGNGVVAMKQFQAESYDITRDANGNVLSYSYINNNDYQSNASYLCVTFGWGIGLAMALYVSGKVSGGHVNPAVTLTNAIFGNMPWKKVPFYIVMQFLGAMTGAACIYALYRPFFDMRREIVTLDRLYKNSTVTDTDALGGIFCTYPVTAFYGNMFCFWSEFFNTMLMQMIICGVGDEEQIPIKKNANARRRTMLKLRMYQQKREARRRQQQQQYPRITTENDPMELNNADFDVIEDILVSERSSGGNYFMTSKPLAIGLLIFELGIATGWCSGYAMNPARDLGPRMVSAMIFRSTDPFTKNDHYFWIPMFIPILGCLVGQLLYALFICPEQVSAVPEEDNYELEEKQLYLAQRPVEGVPLHRDGVGNNSRAWGQNTNEVPNVSGLDG